MCGRLQLGEEGGGERGTVWTLVQLDEVRSCRCGNRKGEGRGGEGCESEVHSSKFANLSQTTQTTMVTIDQEIFT